MAELGGTRMYNFQQKLKVLKAKIRTWNKEEFGNIFVDKKRIVQELNAIQKRGMESGWEQELKEKEKYLSAQLEAKERQEEFFWKQKSRVKWLQEGDKNTKFFHSATVSNRLGSKIYNLKLPNGTQVGTRAEVEEGLVNYFKDIMTEDNIERGQDIDRITSLIPNIVTGEDNENLTKPITLQEVEEVMRQMA